MKLVIDIGNTFSKLAVFKNRDLITLHTTPELSVDHIRDLFKATPNIKSAIVSTVRQYDQNINNELKSKIRLCVLNPQTRLPFRVLYKTHETLGNDRIAAVAGALDLFPGKNILVIDTGTCITYDMVTAANQYLGGAISPGIQMRLKSLNTFTGNLPLIQPDFDKNIDLIGDSTENSILSGVQNAVIMEVDAMIHEYKDRFGDLKIIVTGGDNKYFDKTLKNIIFAAPNLVLSGLNKILDFNESN